MKRSSKKAARAYQNSMGGDTLNPMMPPQPGDPSTQLYANPEE